MSYSLVYKRHIIYDNIFIDLNIKKGRYHAFY